jgi:2-keto-4-pentenoate hydratase/2-oxohepta-3-ene-1,7-dioic acid hydratase in catechol pathway
MKRFGVLNGTGSVVDVNLAYRYLLQAGGAGSRAQVVADAVLPSDLLLYLNTGPVAERALNEALDFVAGNPELPAGVKLRHAREEVRLLAPLAPVSYREFGQFEKHMTRGGTRTLPPVWYEMPIYWKGIPSTTIGPDDTVPWPSFTSRMDFELEIAAVIGKPGINLDPANAMDYVAGFTIFNDISGRDQQFREMEKGTGPCKGKDFANIIGPLLATPDEVDFNRFVVEVRVNGEQWVRTDTADMHFGWPELVSYVSRDEQLVPGDIFTSGTVNGCCGLEHYDWPASGPLLNAGDLVELEVEGIGTLRNRIGQPSRV